MKRDLFQTDISTVTFTIQVLTLLNISSFYMNVKWCFKTYVEHSLVFLPVEATRSHLGYICRLARCSTWACNLGYRRRYRRPQRHRGYRTPARWWGWVEWHSCLELKILEQSCRLFFDITVDQFQNQIDSLLDC